MPNLDGLGLQNFRTFKNQEYLEFAPITLITGANNAGKSSIIKAIQLLANSFKDGIIKAELDFNELKHELGGLHRILNKDYTLQLEKKKQEEKLKDKKSIKFRFLKSNLANSGKGNISNESIKKPITDAKNDLVFTFPITIGGRREIDAKFELRYRIDNRSNKLSHKLHLSAIIKNGEYLHWSFVKSSHDPFENIPRWNMNTGMDLKQILSLILGNTQKPSIFLKPNKKIEHYFEVNLFERIQNHSSDLIFEYSFLRDDNDYYNDFVENFKHGTSLFSSYQQLSEENKILYQKLENDILGYWMLGATNIQSNASDCFNRLNVHQSTIAEQEIKKIEVNDNRKVKSYADIPNTILYRNLMLDIGNDFSACVKRQINSFEYVYSLPTNRGRNREWFIDEQDDNSIKIVKDFSAIHLDFQDSINSFVKFWIGKGEIIENNKTTFKGFMIGEKIEIERIDAIGLTKIFLRRFDDTKIPLIDLGFGISQLIPIIMKIAIIANGHKVSYDMWDEEHTEEETYYFTPSTLLIEEPEANLHPALQSKLAEMLIDAGTRFNIQFIVETHSEYLIYKIQEYIGNKHIKPQDVALYYLNHPETVRTNPSKKYVNRVAIAEDGSIDYEEYFGKGFFDEQMNLKLSLLNIQRGRFIEIFQKTKEHFSLKDSNLLEEEKFDKLALLIDNHFEKIDIKTHLLSVRIQFPNYAKFQSNTQKYLASAYHLQAVYNQQITDYAPAVIQLGRAVECEFMYLFKAAKDYILNLPNFNTDWINKATYNTQVRIAITQVNEKSDFRNYLEHDRLSFGNAKNILHLMSKESVINLNRIPLLSHLYTFLNTIFFKDWEKIKSQFTDLTILVNERNRAAHTYHNNPMTASDAVAYSDGSPSI